jgi:asparagine N-glycosylation enzyme membrane subunit Stt3
LRNKRFLFLALAASLVVASVLVYEFWFAPNSPRTEYIGGKYQCRIEITGQDPSGFAVGRIIYTKDGVEHRGYWGDNMRNTLDWIRNNTPTNAVFLNWWDYGHMIVGYSERESVIKNPSSEALVSVKDPSDFPELDNHTRIVDVARALTSTDENQTLSAMNEYNATYILVAAVDGKGKAGWLFKFAGLNYSDYYNYSWQPTDLPFDADQYNELGKQTVFCRILTNAQIPGLTLVYADQNFTIYRRSD